MLPSLRIILAAVIAACAAVLTLSAGLIGARDPGRNISGVPDLSRALMRQAIVEEPEWQQSQLLAYSSRRADELLRLRELPVTPVRAVVEYAEQAQARAAETASAPAAPPVDSATAPASAASEEGAVVVATAPAATASADAAREPAADSATVFAASPADAPRQPPTPTAAIEPVANPPSDTTAATAVVAAATPAPATAAPAAAPAGGDTQVAAVQTGGSETAEMYGPVRSSAAKPHRGGKTVHARPAKPKKKPQVARAPRNIVPATTSFPADQPSNRPNEPFGNWRRSSNESTTRGNAFPPPPKPRG
jgi:hypothetical protein